MEIVNIYRIGTEKYKVITKHRWPGLKKYRVAVLYKVDDEFNTDHWVWAHNGVIVPRKISRVLSHFKLTGSRSLFNT